MPRAPRGSGSPRRPRAEARTPRETAGSRSPAAPARRESAVLQEAIVIEPPSQAAQPAGPVAGEPRFQIFIIDTGWHSPARKVLHDNFAMLRNLQKGDPIYVLSSERSIEFALSHPSLIGKGPAIVVHDLAALREGGATGFHGFRLHLGLMRSESWRCWRWSCLPGFLPPIAGRSIWKRMFAGIFAARGSSARSRLSCITSHASWVGNHRTGGKECRSGGRIT